jgi:hypothetical protein
MKLVFWNEQTQKHEGVEFAEDKGAWITAGILASFGVLSVVGVLFAIFG